MNLEISRENYDDFPEKLQIPTLKAPICKKRMVYILNYTIYGKTVPQTMLVSVDEEREKSVWPIP